LGLLLAGFEAGTDFPDGVDGVFVVLAPAATGTELEYGFLGSETTDACQHRLSLCFEIIGLIVEKRVEF
jgi:hypothetical protein